MLRNQLKTILLLGILSAVLVGVGGLLGEGYLVAFTALALLINVGSYFFSDRIVLRMVRARPVDEREAPGLHAMVAELARAASIPKPRLYLVPDPGANAFATGRNPDKGVVAVTDGILQVLTPRELRGVLAHEIAHIKNRDTLVSTIAAGIGTAITYMANVLSFSALLGGHDDDEEGSPIGGLAIALVAPMIATLVQLGISRSREYMADETGARIAGDPEALASALEKLHRDAAQVPSHAEPATAGLFIINPFSGAGGLSALFSTHPPVVERVRRLRAMAYEHPHRRPTLHRAFQAGW